MTHSITDIACNKCNHKFTGVLNDIFAVSKQYAATCPACTNEIFFYRDIALIDSDIPKDAVNIKYVAKI